MIQKKLILYYIKAKTQEKRKDQLYGNDIKVFKSSPEKIISWF